MTMRRAKLRRDPWCEVTGCKRPAAEVDHVTPLYLGGAEFDRGNLRSLCREHHRIATASPTNDPSPQGA